MAIVRDWKISGISDDVRQEYIVRLLNHIKYVQEAGQTLGVPDWQLEHHDDSKWGNEEFEPYARYFCDKSDKSPVDNQNISESFARAWLHHIHMNPHHWQHWIFSDGYSPQGANIENGVMQMPNNFALEMVADWMGASYVYTGSWDMTDWLLKNLPKINLHTNTARYVADVLDEQGYDFALEKLRFRK